MTGPTHTPGSRLRLYVTVILVAILQLTPEVQLFSWHSAYTGLVGPQSRSSLARSHWAREGSWYPSSVWWQKRRRKPSSDESETDFPGLGGSSSRGKSQGDGDASLSPSDNLAGRTWSLSPSTVDNRLTTIPLHPTRYPGWSFLRPSSASFAGQPLFSTYPSQVALHYVTPGVSSGEADRRGKSRRKNTRVRTLDSYEDRQLLTNVIDDAVRELRGAHAFSDLLDLDQQVTDVTPALTFRGQGQKLATSASAVKSSSKKTFTDPLAGDSSPLVSPSDFEPFEKGWEAFGGSTAQGILGSKAPPETSRVVAVLRPMVSSADTGPGQELVDGELSAAPAATFVEGKFPQDMKAQDVPPEEHRFVEPPGADSFSQPSALFSLEDRDCDTILTKHCETDSDCLCYGFYHCQADGCKELGSSAGDGGPVTFGEEWYDLPAENPGLARGRRSSGTAARVPAKTQPQKVKRDT